MRRRKQQQGIIKPLDINKCKGFMIEEDEEELLSPGSVIFHKPEFNVHILAVMGCKTSINVEIVKAKLPLTLLKHPRFSSIVVGDPSKGEELRWIRTQVDLDKHIIVPNIDESIKNNIESGEKFVEEYLYNLSKSNLDKSRPLWELHLLQVKTSEEAEAIGIFRIHHSLGDGTSLISLLLALTRKISDPDALPTIPNKRNTANINTTIDYHSSTSSSSDHKGIIAALRSLLSWQWWVLLLCWNTLIDVAMFTATTLFLKDTNTPLKGDSVVYTPRRVAYKIISLDDMKLVKNAMNATINDVALGITQAGLSRYLCRRYGEWCFYGLGNEGNKISNILKHIRLRSLLLINIRPSSGIQILADMMEKDAEAKWGNSIGYVLLPFTLGLQKDDPLEYIRQAKVCVDRKKHSLEALFTFSIAELVKKFLGTKVAGALFNKINSHTTLCFSNLVGPLEEIGFYGHPMAFLAPTSYGQPHPLMINFQSYMNKMMIVLSVEEDSIPDPHRLCQDIADSLCLVKDAVNAQALAKPIVSFPSAS